MKDKEKQIEEMAVLGCLRTPAGRNCAKCQFAHIDMCIPYKIATIYYEQDYRKIDKDSIVLSREQKEEYEQFKSFMERNEWESVEHIETTLDKCQEVLYERLQQASKETAEKLITKIKQFLNSVETIRGDDENKLYREIGYSMREVDDFLDELAKQSGVE